MTSLRVLAVVAFFVAVGALAFGCSTSKGGFADDAGGSDALTFPDVCVGFCTGDGGADGGDPIVITPANVVLNVNAPGTATQAFTAMLDGMDVTSKVSFSYSTPVIGTMTGSNFNASGNAGGVGLLTASYNGSSGTTNITVQLTKTIVNVGGSQRAALDSPTGGSDPSMKILYPYNNTFFPLGVLAPDMQWSGTGSADAYKLVLKEQYYTYIEYFTQGTPADHLMAQTDWSGFELSGQGPKGDPVAVSLSRLSGSTAYNPVSSTWHIVQGLLHGSVYYWELPGSGSTNGRILRIKADSAAVDQFFTNGGSCWGCHTVSRQGDTVLASFDFPIGTVGVSASDAGVKGSCTMGNGTFSAFDNTGTYALVDTDQEDTPSYALNLWNTKTCTKVSPNVYSAFGPSSEPAWSPDGTKIAAITGGTGSGWFFDSSSGNITIANVSGSPPAFSGFKTIVQQSKLPAGRPAYPSFDPSSSYIAFGNPTSGSRSTGNGDLWVTDLTGKFTQLKTAETDNTGLDLNKSFNPVYAPLRAGGYSWIVFISQRAYGNNPASYNQLWVTAIDDPPTTADPSHAPFYMRGQEIGNYSENAYYALDPCKAMGSGCQSGVDCCSGQCIYENGQYVCGTSTGCSQDGNKCTGGGDCCDPKATCVDGYCTPPPPN